MGNGISHCFCASGPPRPRRRRRHLTAAVSSEPLDEGLGHSFCYLSTSSSKPDPAVFSISGASVSANPSTALSTALDPLSSSQTPAAFESSARFSSVPLQPVPRPLSSSGPIERAFLSGFLSGPIERAFLSGPIDPNPIPEPESKSKPKSKPKILHTLRGLARSVLPRPPLPAAPASSSNSSSGGFISIEEEHLPDSSLQWAQGKAGEDRMHVVVSEDHGWVFVGIYDGFNGPDATDYLLTYLYPAVEKELKGLLWDDETLDDVAVDHSRVLKALREALMKTEDTFFDCADMMADENPELALMGSCVLVMLMKGEDVYLLNVGDSRAVLARKATGEHFDGLVSLAALQLTYDHSTSVKEEVIRIRKEHPDDSSAISNDRVKGSLKVTRAFGAGFLKQPKWNDALLEMFRIDYIGTSPYITCKPSLYHHRLNAKDRYLVLSSDGLCQYFTNEEVVAEVELFISTTPEGDPAQHLVEEMLFRAARKAGMDFHELLDIPQGDRRRYHDDVSIIVISFEGRIWKSSV